jgi:uncharacterized protein YybS (DUF2232 family)
MKYQSSTRALVESGLLTAVAVILVLFTMYVPIFYFIGIFIWPMPITLIYIRHNFKYSIMSLVATGLITAMTVDPMTALSITATVGFLGVALGYCVKNKKSVSNTMLIMSVSMFVSMIFVYLFYTLIIGQDMIKLLLDQISQLAKIVQKTYIDAGIPKDKVDMIMKAFFNIELYKMVIPATLILTPIAMSFFSYIISGKIFKRFGYNLEKMAPFSMWYMPAQIAIGVTLIYLISFVLYKVGPESGIKYLLNAKLIFDFVFSINGLSAIVYFLRKREVSKFLSIVIVLLLITSPGFQMILIYAGILDYAFNFRGLDPKRKRLFKDV